MAISQTEPTLIAPGWHERNPQTMSGSAADKLIKAAVPKYAAKLNSGEWSVQTAHEHMVKTAATASVIETAALCKVIACYSMSIEL